MVPILFCKHLNFSLEAFGRMFAIKKRGTCPRLHSLCSLRSCTPFTHCVRFSPFVASVRPLVRCVLPFF
jgi:hypothetical protein